MHGQLLFHKNVSKKPVNFIKMYLLGKIILKLAVGDEINGKT